MKIERCNFKKDDYVLLKASGSYLRRFELDQILKEHRDRRFMKVLELGCGKGGQSRELSKYADMVICTDMNSELLPAERCDKIQFLVADAQDLSQFGDGCFDMVYSSNLLEHLPLVDKCLAECRRVLKDDGIMIHSVPNNMWKIFYVLLFYPGLLKALINRIRIASAGNFRMGEESSDGGRRIFDDNMKRVTDTGLWEKVFPKPHGYSASHFVEHRLWKEKTWIEKFESNDMKVRRIVRLPFYYGHGLSFIAVHRLGNKMGLSSSTAYELSKASRKKHEY